ncbi:hypothetical protein YC2023_002311 [Brassica napus]
MDTNDSFRVASLRHSMHAIPQMLFESSYKNPENPQPINTKIQSFAQPALFTLQNNLMSHRWRHDALKSYQLSVLSHN